MTSWYETAWGEWLYGHLIYIIGVAFLLAKVVPRLLEYSETSSYDKGAGTLAGSFRLGTLGRLVYASTIVGVMLVFAALMLWLHFSPVAWLWLCVAIPGVLYLGTLFQRMHQRRIQQTRDDLARRLAVLAPPTVLKTVKRLTPERYSLYLRPFTSTGQLRIPLRITVRNSQHPITKQVLRSTVEWEDLEVVLSMVLESSAPLVALGEPGEQVGAGRISSDEVAWRDNFRRLADQAINILLLPSTHEGTSEEFLHILGHDDLLSKTLFLLPPDSSAFKPGPPSLGQWDDKVGIGARRDPDIIRLEDARGDASRFLARQRIRNLPDSSQGLIFRIRRDRDVATAVPLVTMVRLPFLLWLVADLYLSKQTTLLSLRALENAIATLQRSGEPRTSRRRRSQRSQ